MRALKRIAARPAAELREPLRCRRTQERCRRIPGPRARGRGGARSRRRLLRGIPRAGPALAGATQTGRPSRRDRGPRLALAAVHGRTRRAGAGPRAGGCRRHGHRRSRGRRRRCGGDDAGAPVSDRSRHDRGAPCRPNHLGARAPRADRRGRLRRRVPFRPGAGGFPSGAGA